MPTYDVRPAVRAASAALALLTGLAGAARADTTEAVWFQGTWDHSPDCWELPDQCQSGPPQDVVGPWTGTLDVTLPSWADGTYDASTAHVVMDSFLGGFDSDAWVGIPFWGSITVSGGFVTSIDATWYYPSAPDVTLTFAGLTMDYDQPHEHHYGPTVGGATLQVPVPLPTVPEPAGWALALAGLAVVGRLRRPVSRASRAAA
ncbi:MAG TPA: PEP-CTERM sorting domain-containing protein [Burkholderiaceae bacterium]